jgi:hypothetical protein
MAHAEAGNFSEAIAAEQMALALARDNDKPAIESRLALFAKKQPFRLHEPTTTPKDDVEGVNAGKQGEASKEKEAESALRLAEALLAKNPEAAKRRLKEIANKYPDTKAGKRALELINAKKADDKKQ